MAPAVQGAPPRGLRRLGGRAAGRARHVDEGQLRGGPARGHGGLPGGLPEHVGRWGRRCGRRRRPGGAAEARRAAGRLRLGAQRGREERPARRSPAQQLELGVTETVSESAASSRYRRPVDRVLPFALRHHAEGAGDPAGALPADGPVAGRHAAGGGLELLRRHVGGQAAGLPGARRRAGHLRGVRPGVRRGARPGLRARQRHPAGVPRRGAGRHPPRAAAGRPLRLGVLRRRRGPTPSPGR